MNSEKWFISFGVSSTCAQLCRSIKSERSFADKGESAGSGKSFVRSRLESLSKPRLEISVAVASVLNADFLGNACPWLRSVTFSSLPLINILGKIIIARALEPRIKRISVVRCERSHAQRDIVSKCVLVYIFFERRRN